MKNLKTLYPASAILNVICAVFWFIPTIVYSTGYFTYSYINPNEKEAHLTNETFALVEMFKEVPMALVIIMLFFVLSSFLLILPLIKKNYEKRRRLIFSKAWTIISFIFYLFIFFVQKVNMVEYKEYDIICKFSFGGWVFLFVHVALIVVLFIISRNTKKIKESVVTEKTDIENI